MWIKICGNTTLDDARLAIDAGADALGFVFAPSSRQVSPSLVAAITARLPRSVPRPVELYGVFVHPTFEQVVETVGTAGLTGVQLHATSDPTLPTRLREHFSSTGGRKRLGLLQVLHVPAGQALDSASLDQNLRELAADHSLDAVLIDSRTASAEGGTGLRFHWAEASGSFLQAVPHLRLIVAGGLAPENIAEAIATLRPWGIDVVTGVESAPGRKDPARVRAFVERARAAARALAAPSPVRA